MSLKGHKSRKSPPTPEPSGQGIFHFPIGYALAFIFGGAATAFVLSTSGSSQVATLPTPKSSTVSHYDLLAMTPDQLAKVDVALMNLLCAKGLPGAEDLDIPAALKKLDEWSAKVKHETDRHLYRVTDPQYAAHYNYSEARLRAEFIVQVLQEDCGVRYNPNRIYAPDFSDSRDTFIHGMLPDSNGGTCASMPIMYVAIGRRLWYPMKLVAAKEHLFCRWDDGKERFNIEGSGNGGVDYPPDDYYRTWPKPLTDTDMATGVFLTSMSPTEELAGFLHHRGMCLHQNGRMPEARSAFAEAHRLQPRDANTFTALRTVCRSGQRPMYSQNPAADTWLRGTMPEGLDDSIPNITIPSVNPAYGIPNQHQPLPFSGVTQETRR